MYVILEPPYVSKALLDAIIDNKIPVVDTPFAHNFERIKKLLTQDINDDQEPIIYSNSENALDWVLNKFPNQSVSHGIGNLKDKYLFRTLIKELHPDFFFYEVGVDEMRNWSYLPTDKSVVIKPTVGFLSLGVIKVADQAQWPKKREKLLDNLSAIEAYYPEAVVNADKFILEEFLDGSEFAIDAYFNSEGEPVILNISEHLFATPNDVNDRVYFTSKEIIKTYHDRFRDYLAKAGKLLELKNFPVHAEVRITSAHGIVPIEFNALRFGGWCTSADVGTYAYGFNLYTYFFKQQVPDWNAILKDKGNDVYSFIMLDNITGKPNKEVKEFDIQALASQLEEVLEVRAFDHQQFPIFGILITRTSESNKDELLSILASDFKEHMTWF